MSLAAETRQAVRRHPFVHDALRAGVLNYTAAARFLADEIDVDEADGSDAIAAALRRYEETLPEWEISDGNARVSMEGRVGRASAEDGEEAILTVGDHTFAPGAGSATAILVTGELDVTTLGSVLGSLRTAEIDVIAAGGSDESLIVVVGRRDGPAAVRLVEESIEASG